MTGNVIQPNGASGGGEINYSTTEHVIGTWIDGKTLYEKTVDCGALPNNDTKNIECLPSGSHVKYMSGVAYNIAGAEYSAVTIPRNDVANNRYIYINFYTRWLIIQTNYDGSAFNGVVTLRYTKAS